MEFSSKLNGNEFKITKWIHLESKIEFTRKDYLQQSGKECEYEYSYILPGISPLEFRTVKEHGRIYQELGFTEDEIAHFFELLENKNLIQKIKSLQLVQLNKERYSLKDNSLKDILLECWTLHNHVFWYLIYRWQGIKRPKDEEIIWYNHFWGEKRSEEWFRDCRDIRTEYKNFATQEEKKQTQERLHWEKLEIIKKFEFIKKEYAKTISDYSYFIYPLLNVVYPIFLRKEFNQ